MGKKACLALDLDYDGDEIYNDDYYAVDDDDSEGKEAATDDAQPKQSNSPTNIKHKKSSPSNVCKSSLSTRDSTEKKSIRITPTSSLSAIATTSTRDAHQVVHISNPHRQPLFTEHVATHDALLYHTVSYLDIKDVTRLSMVSNILNKSLSVDGLYCKNGVISANDRFGGNGILLPCLWSQKDRLLPLLHNNPDGRNIRPRGLSRLFAYECLSFSKSYHQASGEGLSSVTLFQPKQILSMNTPEQLNTISFRSMLWEEHSYNNKKTVKLIKKKSGVRLSYVKNESNNNALVTRWVENDSTTYTHYEQRRFLPPLCPSSGSSSSILFFPCCLREDTEY